MDVELDAICTEMRCETLNRSRSSKFVQAAVRHRQNGGRTGGQDPWGVPGLSSLSKEISLIVAAQILVQSLTLAQRVLAELNEIGADALPAIDRSNLLVLQLVI